MRVDILATAFDLVTLGVQPVMRHVVQYLQAYEEAKVVEARIEIEN